MTVCKGCKKKEDFKSKCWYFWQNKRECSYFEDPSGERFKSIAWDHQIL